MRIKKIGKLFILTAALASLLVGCTTSASYTFNVANGDSVKVKLDTSDGYSLKQNEGHFMVNSGDDQILEGLFLSEEGFDDYDLESPQITILEDNEKDTFSYYFYEYDDGTTVRNYYLIWIFDSKTGVLIGGTADKEETEEAFDRLTLSVDK